MKIAGTQPSRFRRLSPQEADAVAETIRASGARMVFVGLGCPRQEVWAYEYRQRLNMPIVAVGAAFPFHAGDLPQAPPILQRYGLEWLYRLLHEPRRLWKRYLVLNPIFCTLVASQFLRLRNWAASREVCPQEEVRFG
jgi:N-acetylglucosaminyldiphosphoundecaprenol N-acetyl-beta-D-mannosaminyltransferase